MVDSTRKLRKIFQMISAAEGIWDIDTVRKRIQEFMCFGESENLVTERRNIGETKNKKKEDHEVILRRP